MARSVYVTGLEPGGGKSAVALGVAQLLSRRVHRLAVFRPVVRDADDPIVALLRDRFQLTDAGFGTTYTDAAALLSQGRAEQFVARVIERYHEVTDGADAVLVVGSDFGQDAGDSGVHEELAMNARLASEFGAVVIGVVDGAGRTPETVAGTLRSAYHSLVELGTTVAALIANRTAPADRDAILGAAALPPVPVYALPADPAISAPTLAEVTQALGARRILGDDDAFSRDALRYVVGAAHVPVFLDHLADGGVVITPGDRDDLVTATFAAHAAGVVSVAGVVLTLGEVPDARVLDLVGKLRTDLPVISVDQDSFTTVASLAELEGRLTAANPRKIEVALGLFESHVDGRELSKRLDVARSDRVTPLMFEYELIDRARRDPRHVVLPEGREERILRAAEVVLRRGVARLTLLGHPDDISRRARELGLEISGAELVDPATSPLREEFAREYARLRAAKGVTLDHALDTVTDVNYFGTMLVHTGRVDAMVSGATHPTADTIRPAFEIIRTVPEVSVASSVFFMCLADHVLVYGDCAINPDPTAEQLADIALSSARTAARFNVTPRVAMLSYSTGSSGRGADVDKVAAATKLVRERAPELLVEGPIQYDAAVDPAVAATKLPGSAVAGQATVLIFPDLNTGNNTYKAVQRSAGAVAVGPVLQGLRKPVNDLSRGATVPDIINTIAITAIQAQG
ncbi:phosphate acetyltransferase [Luedemannella helvata]|uniref:Phosphate acetyltransferase n=1 Tax=Luedemannella helvata TaxID=349315 RepID=A0ABP4VQ05_9ACTN